MSECKICGKEASIEIDVGYDIYLCSKHYRMATDIFSEIIDTLEELYEDTRED